MRPLNGEWLSNLCLDYGDVTTGNKHFVTGVIGIFENMVMEVRKLAIKLVAWLVAFAIGNA